MKLSAKPISSPGRPEKYPPPLMRFLRSNVGSRSRGRSRTSPSMFVRKKSTAIETQEPSSPKVTCMGQVRVRRSKQAGARPARRARSEAPIKRRCKWVRNALFCHHFAGKLKLKPKQFRPSWRKWVMVFHFGFLRKSKCREDSSRTESKFGNKNEGSVRENEEEREEDDEEEEAAKVFVSSSFSPPKNAFLLTRCRSAPYRSSSLASRFWGSPLASEETKEETQETEQANRENVEEGNPTLEREPICRDSDQESRTDPEAEEKSGFLDEKEERTVKPGSALEVKTEQQSGSVLPLILTRCKSEPARTAAKLDPEMTFWKKRRLGFT